jgi:competence protein ComEC
VFLAPIWVAALRRRGVPRGWAEFLTVPVAAQLTTMPVVVALSGQVSIAAVPANLAVAPVVPAALVIGVLSAVVGPWWPAGGRGLARMDELLLGWISGTAHLLARQSGAAVPWPATAGGVLISAGLVVAMLMLLRHRRIRALLVAVLGGALAVLLPARVIALPGWPAENWLLTACDVGQGDAMVLATDEPDVAVLVDTGPDPALVDGCLDSLGIGTIPLLVLTHLHADHVDGLAGALDGRSVGAIGIGPETEPAPALAQVYRIAAAHRVPVTPLAVGSRWSTGGLDLDVLAPRQVFHGTDSDPNNDSVVLMARRDGIRMLMTGDIETQAQQQLLNSGIDLHADVLKVPHHGSSKDLPSFLAAVSPDVAVIGVGKDNDYGHPSPRTLDELRRVGTAAILRTDTEGDVAVGVVDGELTTTIRGP